MSISNTGTGEKSSEPFRTYAERYLDMGLSVVPCDKGNGKLPSIKWKWLQTRRVGGKLLDKYLVTFASANIGIVTGKKSGITVIDCDNPEITTMELCATYGETPLIAKTPSGGTHLYYKHNGERSATGIAPKIDIRGEGGVIIAPPSYNHVTGELYHFIEGGIWEIPNLPFIKNNSEIQREYNEGERNTNLYYYLLGEAANCPDIANLTMIAEAFNNEYMSPPEDDHKKIAATIAQVWKYKIEGQLFVKGKQSIILDEEKIQPLKFKHSKALDMYIDLLQCHKGRKKTFSLSPKAYAKRCGWSKNTVSNEMETLICNGLIMLIYQGGKKGKHDPSKYKFL